jgi:hypothetical protein
MKSIDVHPSLRGALPALLSALTITAGAHRAQASCADGNPWSGGLPMKVVINETIDNDLCPGSSCGSFNDIRWTSQAVFHEYFQGTGSNFRVEYDGTTNVARGTVVPGKVHLFSNPCTGGTLAIAAWDVNRTWGKIRMCTSNDNGVIDWRSNAFDNVDPAYSFQNVLLHELGHTIGMSHGLDCSTTRKTVMNDYYERDGSHLFASDIDFLQDTFGLRSHGSIARETQDALTWSPGNLPPWETGMNRGRFAATNNQTGYATYVAFTDNNTGIRLTADDLVDWVHESLLPASSHYHPGIAGANDSGLRVSYLSGYNTQTGLQTVSELQTSNGGASWSSPVAISTAATESHTTSNGVSSAFDPATGRFITIWRGGYNSGGSVTHTHEIFYRIGTSPPQRLLQASGAPYLASDTPSIACGPTSVVGAQNCLIAWVDGVDWHRTVKWVQASAASGVGLAASSVKTHGYMSMGSPSVAYHFTPGTRPWYIALTQGGSTVYTWRKEGSASASFTDERSHVASPHATTPALGTRLSGAVLFLDH